MGFSTQKKIIHFIVFYFIVILFGTSLAIGAESDADPSEAISEADMAVRAEIVKAAIAHKAYAEGLEGYRQEQRLNLKAKELEITLKQPSTMCQAVETQDSLLSGYQKSQSKMIDGQRSVLKNLGSNVNTGQTVANLHAATNDRFCSDDEVNLSICKPTTESKYENLAGADQNAMYLFQSNDGTQTYEGERDGAQVDAVNSYISRVVVGVPPEQLKNDGHARYLRSPESRAYAELLRRYKAFLSMSSYSLNQIKESRNPLK